MVDERGLSSTDVQDVAETVALPLSTNDVSSMMEPIESILSSMSSVFASRELEHEMPTVRSVERPDPFNAFITQIDVPPTRDVGPLLGHDVAVKDNIAVAGVKITAGSGVLEPCRASRNAVVVDRLLDAGGTIIGKTNMDEFAFGPTGETSYFGPTTNPRNPNFTPGGSSSGSAAAVASGEADLALGTDTGGSVRIPASYTGVVGMKPSLGTVPKQGVIELAGSLDTVGLLAGDFDLLATALGVVGNRSLTNHQRPIQGPDSLVFGVPESLYRSPVAESVAERIRAVLDHLADEGASIRTIPIPSTELSSATWRTIVMSEFYLYVRSNGLPYRVPDDFIRFEPSFGSARQTRLRKLSDPLKWYLIIGGYLVSQDQGRMYALARQSRNQLKGVVETVYDDVDVVITPTTPTTAYRFDEFSRDESPPINHNTHLFNLTGQPAISIPAGDIEGLPIGLQLASPTDTDSRLIEIARTVRDICRKGDVFDGQPP